MDGKGEDPSLEHMVQRQFKSALKDPVYGKQQLPMFGLNSGKPQSSEEMKIRTVAKNHESQKRFAAYERVEGSLKAKERRGTSPPFALDSSILPKSIRTSSTGYRTSHYPKSSLTPELEQKVSLLSAYKALVFSNEFPKDKGDQCCPSPPIPPKVRGSGQRTDHFDLVSFKEALGMERRCGECRAVVCKCVKVVRDDYLRKIRRRISKSRAKIEKRLQQELEEEEARLARPVSKTKGQVRIEYKRGSQGNCSYEEQSPQLGRVPLRHSFMRHSLGDPCSPAPKRARDRYFHSKTHIAGSSEPLETILQVSQASFSHNNKRKSKKTKFDLPAEDSEDSEDLNERLDLEEMSVKL